MADRTEIFIRMALRHYPQPLATADFAAGVSKLAQAQELMRHSAGLKRRRYALAGVWTSVALASAGILGAINWPAPPDLPELSPTTTVLGPLACAAWLGARKLVSFCARLAPRLQMEVRHE